MARRERAWEGLLAEGGEDPPPRPAREPTGAPSPPRTVVDTSVFRGGRPLPEPALLAFPEGVLAELTLPGRENRRLETMVAAGAAVMRPSEAARARVRDAATRTGDLPKLSATDQDVLALALDLGGGLLSDDYRIQNVGRALGVAVTASDLRGIEEAWAWVPRCTGCRRTLEAMRDDCPVCGSPVKLVRKR